MAGGLVYSPDYNAAFFFSQMSLLRFGAESGSRFSAKRRSGFGDAVECDQANGAGQADEQVSNPSHTCNGLKQKAEEGNLHPLSLLQTICDCGRRRARRDHYRRQGVRRRGEVRSCGHPSRGLPQQTSLRAQPVVKGGSCLAGQCQWP